MHDDDKTEDLAAFLAEAAKQAALSPEDVSKIQEEITTAPSRKEEEEEEDFRNLLPNMTMAEKLKYALFGGQVPRSLLIFDSKRIIQESVLKNPRITHAEIEMFLKNSSMGDFVLRSISQSREWMRSYTHKLLLVSNPKTPQDVSMKWLRYLNSSDLKKLAKSHNIPNTIATAAGRIVATSAKKQ